MFISSLNIGPRPDFQTIRARQVNIHQKPSQTVTEPLPVSKFGSGLAKFFDRLNIFTSNSKSLSWIKGQAIPFSQNWSTSGCNNISKAISHLLEVGTIQRCTPCMGQFFSPMFLVPKSDGTNRLIFNLKKINTFITVEHFKMETKILP